MSRNLFFIGVILAATGLVSPPIALLGGILYALLLPHPFAGESRGLARFLLEASVVCLGFGMNLHEVLDAGRSGVAFTALSIAVAMICGMALGRVLRVGRKCAFLISAGTAICGGSAIAAVGPIAQATEEEMAVSLGAIFILNSVALFLFPAIGRAMHLTQAQFGLWSALAIQDTSSVIGATARYGAEAMRIGATVKLVRALWIIPISFVAAASMKSRARIRWPWFIGFFCLAAVAGSFAPALHPAFAQLDRLGRAGLTVTLFLIGSGLNRKALTQVGIRPLSQGLVLWLIVGAGTLALIAAKWIRF